ncbi:DUF5658 family protein [Sutcliffiella rhizosphaerae]|uniref:DUF5658 domain-containing protein n=1 Tax=Sutcliffiella rhizosphaerae TaxID=2880967 RepID=A0ABM8YH97_9BACI|nr:hypothetical protein BACCIP111883_00020 [Sutcliffiella rhizosphaerae]
MIKKLLLLLLILNIFDGVATFYGLSFKLIEESNPLMRSLYETNPHIFITLKLGLSLLLIYFIKSKKLLTSTVLKSFTIIAVACYSFVCVLHLYWLFNKT